MQFQYLGKGAALVANVGGAYTGGEEHQAIVGQCISKPDELQQKGGC